MDYIIENGGSGTLLKSIASVKRGGSLALIGFLSQPKEYFDVVVPLMDKMATARSIAVGNRQLFEELVQFVHAKKLHMPVEKEFSFTEENVHKAFSLLEGQSHIGKIVITLD